MKVDYSRENLMAVHPTTLRAMIIERTHHTVEIRLYQALGRGRSVSSDTGDTVREMLSIWKERGLPVDENSPDWAWVMSLLAMAERSSKGETVDLSRFAWKPFDESERAVAGRLIRERRSVRLWTDEEVPDWMIDEVLQAGLWAPHSCNLCSLRFLVVRENNWPGLFKGGDIPGGPVHIVACQDLRAYEAQRGYLANPERHERDRSLDCGAAVQNMLLTAHALGLGAVWMSPGGRVVQRLREHFELEDRVQVTTYLDLGLPAQTPMPPGRMALEDVVIARA